MPLAHNMQADPGTPVHGNTAVKGWSAGQLAGRRGVSLTCGDRSPAARAGRAGCGPARTAPRDAADGSCPGPKPPRLAVKRPARPYKRAIETRFRSENAEEA